MPTTLSPALAASVARCSPPGPRPMTTRSTGVSVLMGASQARGRCPGGGHWPVDFLRGAAAGAGTAVHDGHGPAAGAGDEALGKVSAGGPSPVVVTAWGRAGAGAAPPPSPQTRGFAGRVGGARARFWGTARRDLLLTDARTVR